jgi:ABC-type transporter Mla subunit MlaD
MIPSSYYFENYGGKFADIKRMLKDIDQNLDLPDLSSPEPSIESLQALVDFISGSQSLNEIIGKDSADALKDFSDASSQTADNMADVADKQQAAIDAQTKTSESFQDFADAIGTFSDSISDSSEDSDKMLELYQKFEEANLGEFIDKIGELAPLADMMDKVEDGKGAGELIAGLQELDMDPKEIGEKLAMVQELRDEFDEYRTEQEGAQEERDEKQAEKDEEQDRAMKDASREGTDAKNAQQAASEG